VKHCYETTSKKIIVQSMTQVAENNLSPDPVSESAPTKPCHSPARSPQLSWVERQESLKAGLVGGVTAGALVGLLGGLGNFGAAQFAHLAALYQPLNSWAFAVSGAIAVLSGFLFAVTYRYVIRQDQNPHLKSGAVSAFALVRGLAFVEMGWESEVAPIALIWLMLQSVALFTTVRWMLDWAIARSWLQPFKG
jgi:hypothetical protein